MSAHCTVSCRTVHAFSRLPFLHTEGCHSRHHAQPRTRREQAEAAPPTKSEISTPRRMHRASKLVRHRHVPRARHGTAGRA
eukprot:3818204-Prymnesium_polylepis.1